MPQLPHVGERFGRYRIDAEIGRGGMGVVFSATDTGIDRVVALKVVSSSLGESDEFRQRFEREAAVLARINSPHIIAIFDYGQERDCPYIATQYVGGGDLGGLIAARGPMPPGHAAAVCAQVADALHDAHRVGVVHRDVKPTNVLLRDADTAELHAYLCDFGIARTASEGLTSPGAIAGTWSYLAPECGRGAPGTPASDVYAVGCLLWAALVGSAPYRGTDVEIAVAHQRAPIPQLGGADPFSRKVSEVLALAMAKDPAARYADADQLRVALLEAAALEAGPMQPVYPPAPLASPSTRSRRLDRLTLGGSTAGSGRTGGSGGTGSTAGRGSAAAAAAGSSPGAPAGTPPGGSPAGAAAAGSGQAPSPRRTGLVVGAAAAAVVLVAGGVFGLTRLIGGDDTPAGTAGAAGPETAITGDYDGDGLGDLKLVTTFPDPDGSEGNTGFGDLLSWRSDGEDFVEDGSVDLDREPTQALFPFQGTFDDDAATDVLTLVVDGTDEDAAPTLRVEGTTSDGTEVEQELPNPGDGLVLPSTGDLDGDGDSDLVLLRFGVQDDPVVLDQAIYEDGGFAETESLFEVPAADATLFSAGEPTIGDYDGDGVADLAVTVRGEREDGSRDLYPYTVRIYYARDGSFEEGPERSFRGSVRAGLAVDVDGDGNDEFVGAQTDFESIKLRVFETDGEELSAPFPRGLLDPDSTQTITPQFAVTDADGDGDDDVVLVTTTTATSAALILFRSDGRGFATAPWGTWDGPFTQGLSATTVGGEFL